MIGLIPSITDFFVFGDTLMRGFYTIHSDEKALVGLVPHRHSSKPSPEFAQKLPKKAIDATWMFGLTNAEIGESIGESIGGVFAVIVIVGIIYYCYTKKDKNDEDDKDKKPDSPEQKPQDSQPQGLKLVHLEDLQVLILPDITN